MPELKTAIDVLKLTDKSNCRKCGVPTCLAFSAQVINGGKNLVDCSRIDPDTLALYAGTVKETKSLDDQGAEDMKALQQKVAELDYQEVSDRTGLHLSDGKLTVHCLGKKMVIDSEGGIATDIHVNPWIAGPVLNYILSSKGMEPTGNWVKMRDLPGGKDWQRFFNGQCEKPCKEVADTNPDFFNVLVSLFNGEKVEERFESDVSMILHPLPKFPILFCYWKSDGDLPSDLNIFFDEIAEENLPVELIYSLGTGLVLMFKKISQNHGYNMG